MTVLKKLERDYAVADLASVNKMLTRLTEEDIFLRFSLEERRDELEEEISSLGETEDASASVALFFGGRPVIADRGIESEFGGQAVQLFQDLISKQFAQDGGRLGERGVVPDKSASRMHITNIVRGSFGFLLEEMDFSPPLIPSSLKESVDHVSNLVAALGEENEDAFETAAENVEQRVMDAAKAFFTLLRQEGATLRILSSDKERSFSPSLIEKAVERATYTSITEMEERITGILSGVLPESHMFEFKTETSRGTFKGKVDKGMSAQDLSITQRNKADSQVIGVFSVRKVFKRGSLSRENLTLLAIENKAE